MASSVSYCLKIRNGGLVEKSESRNEYVGGQTCVIKNCSFDEWGMITIREKLDELGYKNLDDCNIWGALNADIINLVSDSDAWKMIQGNELPSELEIWFEGAENRNSESEGSNYEGNSEHSDAEYDDTAFAKNVDRNVEYGGCSAEAEAEAHEFEGDGPVEEDSDGGIAEPGNEDDDDGGEPQNGDRLPMFKPKRDMRNPELSLGLIFPCKKKFHLNLVEVPVLVADPNPAVVEEEGADPPNPPVAEKEGASVADEGQAKVVEEEDAADLHPVQPEVPTDLAGVDDEEDEAFWSQVLDLTDKYSQVVPNNPTPSTAPNNPTPSSAPNPPPLAESTKPVKNVGSTSEKVKKKSPAKRNEKKTSMKLQGDLLRRYHTRGSGMLKSYFKNSQDDPVNLD